MRVRRTSGSMPRLRAAEARQTRRRRSDPGAPGSTGGAPSRTGRASTVMSPESAGLGCNTGSGARRRIAWLTSSGKSFVTTTTPMRHRKPPGTTAACGPTTDATVAASMSPIRGRSSHQPVDGHDPSRNASGVSSCTRVDRKTADRTSAGPPLPRTTSASENGENVDQPECRDGGPQTTTAITIARPMCRTG